MSDYQHSLAVLSSSLGWSRRVLSVGCMSANEMTENHDQLGNALHPGRYSAMLFWRLGAHVRLGMQRVLLNANNQEWPQTIQHKIVLWRILQC